MKARYANHYGLKGTFVWEVDADNFRGLFNSKPFTILKALNHAAISGQGLSGDEFLGHGNENLGAPFPGQLALRTTTASWVMESATTTTPAAVVTAMVMGPANQLKQIFPK